MSVIELRNISKKYRLTQEGNFGFDTLKDRFGSFFSRRKKGGEKEFWALDDISFSVLPGERIGLMGKNGAGKSTLLKVISSITAPTKGFFSLTGRLVSLLEVGSGFHPELTGRENIFLNGAILGMSKKEILKSFDEIVHFSEIERFLDLPVKRFSSGMHARLGFSIAAHVDPDILIVDEVFSIGDRAFQQKCIQKLEEFGKRGVTLFFVGHNLSQLISICQRGLLLERGRLIFDGPVEKCAEKYLGALSSENGVWSGKLCRGGIELSSLSLIQEGSLDFPIEVGKECRLQMECSVFERFSSLGLEVMHPSQWVMASSFFEDQFPEKCIPLGRQVVEFVIDTSLFHPGDYSIRVHVGRLNERDSDREAIFIPFPLHKRTSPEEIFLEQRLNGISLGNRWKRL